MSQHMFFVVVFFPKIRKISTVLVEKKTYMELWLISKHFS